MKFIELKMMSELLFVIQESLEVYESSTKERRNLFDQFSIIVSIFKNLFSVFHINTSNDSLIYY